MKQAADEAILHILQAGSNAYESWESLHKLLL